MALAIISLLAFAAWIGLAATRLPPFRRPPGLGWANPPTAWPPVVAVIPARDEEETIGKVVAAHAASEYRGRFSVIVIDDHSADATAEQARAASKGNLDLIEAPPLPAGWTGKLWAVNTGLARAKEILPDAKYILMTDADIQFAPNALARLVAQAEETGAALTSLMARLDARGFWGGLLIPAFVYFFQKLYPFRAVNNPSSRAAAAAGGCMLLRRDALEAIGGVAAIRGRLIDDCALAEAVKKSGRPIWIGLARNEAVSLRDNRALSAIWSMVSRSAFAQLNHSWLLLAGTVAGMILLYLAAPAIALTYPMHGDELAAVFAAAAWALMAITYAPTLAAYGQSQWRTFALPAAAMLYTLMTIHSAISHARGRGGAWKGRTYPA